MSVVAREVQLRLERGVLHPGDHDGGDPSGERVLHGDEGLLDGGLEGVDVVGDQRRVRVLFQSPAAGGDDQALRSSPRWRAWSWTRR